MDNQEEKPKGLMIRQDDTTLYCRVCDRTIQITKTFKSSELQHMRSLVHIQNLQNVFLKHEQNGIEKKEFKQESKKEKKLNKIKQKLEILLQSSYRFNDLKKNTQKRYVIVFQKFLSDIGKTDIQELTLDDILSYLEANNSTRIEAPLKFLMHEQRLRFDEEQKQKFQHLKLQRVITNQSELTKIIHSYDQHFYRFLTELFERGNLLIFLIVFLVYYYRMNVEQMLKYRLIDLKQLGVLSQRIIENEPKFLGKKLKELVEMLQSQRDLKDDQCLINPPLTRRDVTRIFSKEVKEMEKTSTDTKYQKFLGHVKLVQIKQVVRKKGLQLKVPSSEDDSQSEFPIKSKIEEQQSQSEVDDSDEIIINLNQEDVKEIVENDIMEKIQNTQSQQFHSMIDNCAFLSKKYNVDLMFDN